MLSGELSALKHEIIYLQEPVVDGKVNYDPEDETTKGNLNTVFTFIMARLDDDYLAKSLNI